MRKAGLEDRIEIRLQDYRDITGQYDKIASIEMLEAVGDKYHKTWAAIAGLDGQEENTLFERSGDELTETGKLVLGEGDTFSMLPLDIHTIKAVGGPTRHIHWYGKGFSEQTGKVAYFDGAWIDVPADMIPVDESRRVL